MNLLEQLRRDEGVKRSVYPDQFGYLTVGVGFMLDERKGGGLDDEEIDFILAHRVKKIETALDTRYPWFAQLDRERQAALINMAYQLGLDGLDKFQKMLGALRDGRWAEAEYQALDSAWAKQTPERARRVASQIRTGEMQ